MEEILPVEKRICFAILSKKEDKDQESIQSSTSPDPGQYIGQ